MKTLSLNTNPSHKQFYKIDLLSVFKQSSEKNLSIHYGMSSKEISELVSDRLIEVVKEQFEATKRKFEYQEQQ